MLVEFSYLQKSQISIEKMKLLQMSFLMDYLKITRFNF